MEKRYLIFISSTYEDLVEEREKVIRTVLEQNCIPATMEFFPAVGLSPIDLIKKVLSECDYYILIMGARYGIIGKNGRSFTEEEYDIAVEMGIPVMAFLHRHIDSLPIGKSDVDENKSNKLANFREKVKNGSQTIKYWYKADELASLVSSSIPKVIELMPRRGWVRGYKKNDLPKHYEVDTMQGSYVVKIDDVEFKMNYVEGGSFMMGAPLKHEKYKKNNARLVHKVTVDDYWIGETQVTQALWVKMMGYNPSFFSPSHGKEEDLRLPVEQVTFNDCQEFINKLNELIKIGVGIEFDFPTEEQWEYAARGGRNRNDYDYAGSDECSEVARYANNAGGKTWPCRKTGSKPNELDLYDMSGNVWEWCKTIYYESENDSECKGDESAKRVCRGGCWHSEMKCCQVNFHQGKANMTHAGNGLGLRLVLNKKN